ncbi:MAG: hypothetical protein F6K44_18825 [Moorea sp. SIO3E2]|nr:hypothetical protein [Moorena sp. SIO3E2]
MSVSRISYQRVAYQLSACRVSAISYQLSAISYQLSAYALRARYLRCLCATRTLSEQPKADG